MSNQITINTLPGRDIRIEPAPVKRDWMEATPDRYAYRCLPLNIANAHGWQILCSSTFRVRWNGANSLGGLAFDYSDKRDPPAISHFGSGIVTFHIPAVITTPPGVALFATGPVNAPKDGCFALTGIIETDWLPFSFTMNWQIRTKGEWITFEEGEPICMIFPVRLAEIEQYDMVVQPLSADPDLEQAHADYAQSRAAFLTEQKSDRSEERRKNWQKFYFRGAKDGARHPDHRTSLKLAKPRR